VLYKLSLICTIIFSLTSNSFATQRCDLLAKLDSPALASNEKFWNEYSELAGKNKLTDRNLEDLLNKHGAGPSKNLPEVKASLKHEPMEFSMTKKATKEAKHLNEGLKKKFNEFMEIMSDKSGLKELYDHPGRWRPEKLTGKDTHTVRLNSDVRVEFRMDKDSIEILQINADDIHAM
jgi:Txe/YoeB family toxin of Txe-Axe toxin-antitoxin module